MYQNPAGIYLLAQGTWGDIRSSGASQNGGLGGHAFDAPPGSAEPCPDHIIESVKEAGVRPGWHGTGSPGWLHKYFGEDGLKPKQAQQAKTAA